MPKSAKKTPDTSPTEPDVTLAQIEIAAPESTSVASLPAPRVTKIDILLGLLRRPEGADVVAMAAATGWQVHSVRGALSGHVKKKLGLTVVSAKADGRTTYRIEA